MEKTREEWIDLGSWVGRQQAFAVIANKCSAAQALALKQLKESRGYQDLGLTWDQFCIQYAGISRETADRIIRQYDEFGEAYFRFSELARISPETYRQIAGHVHDETLELDGEELELIPENVPKIRAALHTLRARLRAARNETHPVLSEIQARQDAVLADAARMVHNATPTVVKPYIKEIAQDAIRKWQRLSRLLEDNPAPVA